MNEPNLKASHYQPASSQQAPEVPPDTSGPSTPEHKYKAVPRRLDWTPALDDQPETGTPGTSTVIQNDDLRAGLMDNFGFKTVKVADEHSEIALDQGDNGVFKRRKIDIVEVGAPIVQRAEKRKRVAAPKKPKAAAKKAKTITDLVTSHHQQKNAPPSALLDYLSATQAQLLDGSLSEEALALAMKQRKVGSATVKKKTSLLSPTSAMKVMNQQQAMFGSLSQLVRDDHNVELVLSSDPVSPLRTQPFSVESNSPIPTRGISRFVKTRNLWGAADRDENNALVFVDTAEAIDSPIMTGALAGQDVLVDHDSHKVTADTHERPAAAVGKLTSATPLRAFHTAAVVDVDDLPSPAIDAADGGRTSTTAPQSAPPPISHDSNSGGDAPASVQNRGQTSGIVDPTAPPKPRYTGMHTDDLKKAIQSYGFKPIKSRGKMIEKLDQCWEAKEARRIAKATQLEATQTLAMKQSDFLSDVHGLAARPVPKVKKTKTPKAKATKAAKADATAKVPRKRKSTVSSKTNEGEGPETTPAPPQEAKKRKRATPAKKAAIDDLETALTPVKEPKKRKCATSAKETEQDDPETALTSAKEPKKSKRATPVKAGKTEDDSTVAEPKPRKRATAKKKADGDDFDKPKKLRGRPPKSKVPSEQPIVDVDDLDDDFTNLTTIREEKEKAKQKAKSPRKTGSKTASSEVATAGDSGSFTEEPDMHHQIYKAILFQSEHAAKDTQRNHIRDPTWHEKILLYDPIVLEDLARWLNSAGLAGIQEDREVTALDVRGWCEINGICCLWKGGWRGNGARNLKGGSD